MAKLTAQMAEEAIADGATVVEPPAPEKPKRKVQKPPPAPERAETPVMGPDHTAELQALRAEISELRQALAAEQAAAGGRSQELTALVATLSENKPLRLKPVRDLDRNSPTYLLVEYYDFVPVTYKPRKLNS